MPLELSAIRNDCSGELDAYERLLTDAMQGDTLLFVREDAVESAWPVVAKIINQETQLIEYAAGT